MKKLHLVLKGKWYDMIDSGIKTEEYREIIPYWINRICKKVSYEFETSYTTVQIKSYDIICFHRGYTNTTMEFKVKDITIGKGKPEWGAPEKEVFIIRLGERL